MTKELGGRCEKEMKHQGPVGDKQPHKQKEIYKYLK